MRRSKEFFVGGFLGDIGGSVPGELNTQIGEKLFAVDGGILDETLSEVEGSLELAVVGVVCLISDGHQIEIASSLV